MTAFVYKWDNVVTNEYYIGVHKGSVDDSYKGSGALFKRKYKKNPDQWKRTIVEIFEEYALALEAALVTETEAYYDRRCLNMKPGGIGGGVKWDSSRRARHSQLMKNTWRDADYRIKLSRATSEVWTEEYINRRRDEGTLGFGEFDRTKSVATRRAGVGYKHRLGYVFSEESKTLLSQKAKTREKIECPHCSKVGAIPQMRQWHFEKCKEAKC